MLFNLIQEKEFNIPILFKTIYISGTFTKSNKYREYLYQVLYAFELISGQRPLFTKARTSNASFHFKKDGILGFTVTIRNNFVLLFLQKFISSTLPRARDYEGFFQKALKKNKLAFGLQNVYMFEEIDSQYELFNKNFGCNIQLDAKCSKEMIEVLTSIAQIPIKI
jgi:large subunit ribosomal protein L5